MANNHSPSKSEMFLKKWRSEFESVFEEAATLQRGYRAVSKNNFVHVGSQRQVHVRKRIPNSVAFEIARALHFCSGTQKAIGDMHDQLYSPKFLTTAIMKIELLVKVKIFNFIDTSLTKNPDGAKTLKRERRRISRFKFKWTFLGYRKADLTWSSHLKETLIKSILSHGRKKIIKGLKGYEKAQKKLIKKMERRNRLTLR